MQNLFVPSSFYCRMVYIHIYTKISEPFLSLRKYKRISTCNYIFSSLFSRKTRQAERRRQTRWTELSVVHFAISMLYYMAVYIIERWPDATGHSVCQQRAWLNLWLGTPQGYCCPTWRHSAVAVNKSKKWMGEHIFNIDADFIFAEHI